MLTVDGNGLSLSGNIENGGRSEVKLALKAVDAISVSTRALTFKRRPERLVADKGYDAQWLRQKLKKRGIYPFIPKRRKKGAREAPKMRKTMAALYKWRWLVERTFAWLGWKRKLLIRWERNVTVYQGFFNIACMLLVLKEVLK